jgi:hypothetical protein
MSFRSLPGVEWASCYLEIEGEAYLAIFTGAGALWTLVFFFGPDAVVGNRVASFNTLSAARAEAERLAHIYCLHVDPEVLQ